MEPTIMKQLNFKKIFLNLLWPLLPFTAQAQENNTLYSILSKDSILVPSPSVQNQEEDIVTQIVFMQDGKLVLHKNVADLKADTGKETVAKSIIHLLQQAPAS